MIQQRPPVFGADTSDVVRTRLERRFSLIHGGDRVTHDLHRLAVDLVGRAEHDELRPDEKALLHRSMMRAVRRTDVALAALFLRALAEALEDLPDALWERLDLAEVRRHIGVE